MYILCSIASSSVLKCDKCMSKDQNQYYMISSTCTKLLKTVLRMVATTESVNCTQSVMSHRFIAVLYLISLGRYDKMDLFKSKMILNPESIHVEDSAEQF